MVCNIQNKKKNEADTYVSGMYITHNIPYIYVSSIPGYNYYPHYSSFRIISFLLDRPAIIKDLAIMSDNNMEMNTPGGTVHPHKQSFTESIVGAIPSVKKGSYMDRILESELNILWTNHADDRMKAAFDENPDPNNIWKLKQNMKDGGDKGEIEFNKDLANKIDSGKHFMTKFEEFVPVEDHDNWHQTGKSCYGASIIFLLEYIDGEHTSANFLIEIILHICFTAFCLLPVILVGGVQGVLLYYLWNTRPQINDSKSCFCQSEPILMIAALIAFFAFTLPSLDDILEEFYIVLHAKLKFSYNKDNGRCQVRFMKCATFGRYYSILVIVWEIVVWIGVLIVGTLYIITSSTTGGIIQAIVAIVFINDIDNLAEYFYRHGKDITSLDIKTTRFKANMVNKFTPIVKILEVLLCNQFMGPIFITLVSIIVVYSARDYAKCNEAEISDYCEHYLYS